MKSRLCHFSSGTLHCMENHSFQLVSQINVDGWHQFYLRMVGIQERGQPHEMFKDKVFKRGYAAALIHQPVDNNSKCSFVYHVLIYLD